MVSSLYHKRHPLASVLSRLGILAWLLAAVPGCSSLQMQQLPIEVQVIDAVSRKPIPGATVELWWRTGFGGIYWGKPIAHAADSNGVVRFTSDNIPALDELGGQLKGGELKKVMIEGWIVTAPGHDRLVIRPTSARKIAVLEVAPRAQDLR